MQPYLDKMRTVLCGEVPEDIPSILYSVYRELHPGDPEPIRRDFAKLDKILGQLSLHDCDQVWNLTCRLCSEHAEAAFLEGIRVGAVLMLDINAQQ